MKLLKQNYIPTPRDLFLESRAIDVDLMKQAASNPVNNVIVVDPGDEIICDLCNADVDEDPVWVGQTGLHCKECRG